MTRMLALPLPPEPVPADATEEPPALGPPCPAADDGSSGGCSSVENESPGAFTRGLSDVSPCVTLSVAGPTKLISSSCVGVQQEEEGQVYG